MLILALDTTTRAGSIAVLDGATVLVQATGDPAITYGQRLPGDIARVLERAELSIDRIDLLAVAAGPGSFTGLRVGIASAQGIAFARNRKVVPVSTLDALARHAAGGAGEAPLIGAWVDAQRGEVFGALYDAVSGEEIAGPTALRPEATLDAWRDRLESGPAAMIGDGAVRYAAAIRDALGDRAVVLEGPPLAPIVGRIAAEEPERAVLPHAIVPLYVRRPDAELARDRK